jgi:predicted 2-oxoglutarate/Fe(II)-dependent dioxygenase YbiX
MEPAQVVIADEFISQEHCRLLIGAFDKLAKLGRMDGTRHLGSRTEILAILMREAGDEAFRLVGATRLRILEIIRNRFGVESPLYLEATLFSAMHLGDRHSLHADRELLSDDGRWVPNHTPYRDYTGIMYLNSMDHDFSGGLLHFSELDISIMPITGRLVAFECDRRFRHEVTPVIAGTRYSLSCWLTSSLVKQERWEH